MLSEEGELISNSSVSNYDYDSDDTESGEDSDDFDLLELGEIGEELCQVGNQYCSIPFELYDLHDLTEILSVDSWNNCLTEDERFSLSEYLPDMDQSTFMETLKELLSGANFHFGSPLIKFSDMLNGGLCEPRVALYRQSLNFFQNKRHYHLLREYHNSMVDKFNQMRDAMKNRKGYGVVERDHTQNLMISRKRLMYEKMDESGSETESSGRETFDNGRSKRTKSLKLGSMTDDRVVSRYEKKNAKGVLKLTKSKVHSDNHGPSTTRPYASKCTMPQQEPETIYDSRINNRIALQRDQKDAYECKRATDGLFKPQKKHQVLKSEDCFNYDRKLTRSQIDEKDSHYLDKSHLHADGDWINTGSSRAQHLLSEGNPLNCSAGSQPFSHRKRHVEDFLMGHRRKLDGSDIKSKKRNVNIESINHIGHNPNFTSYRNFPPQTNDQLLPLDYTAKTSQKKMKRELVQNGGRNMEGDSNQLRRKLAFSCGALDGSSTSFKFVLNPVKDNMFVEKDKNPQSHYLHKSATTDLVDIGQMQLECHEKLEIPAKIMNKGRFDCDYHLPKSNYLQDYSDNEEDESHLIPRLRNRGSERSSMSLSGCNSLTKKSKEKADVSLTHANALDGSNPIHPGEPLMLKRPVKWNMESESGDSLVKSVTPDVIIADTGLLDLEPDVEPAQPFALITPTVHIGFSFSIIHLLSAVRMALITPFVEDFSVADKVTERSDEVQKPKEEQMGNHESLKNVSYPHSDEYTDSSVVAQVGDRKFPSLTIQEIVSRVRSNPGDPSILETLEPLQDLVRGVLKLFSSKTAPLGATDWKTLVFYEKTSKNWSWIGPVSSSSSNPDSVEEDISAKGWGIPHRMLVKLVDAFADWLKNEQETLQLIRSLPAPPLMLMQPSLDVKERFKDLRAQRSLSTINPSSEEVRAYFHKEELLRYLVPDRAFSYTAADGIKSMVAPLRRFGGKLTSKCRDHFMLKPDRPPHVTILCVVRDAASRLPGGMGTRADVCTLIRDSQYVVETIDDAQVNQVVSGAMDRLHYELDPCVQFDTDRKFWIYLHRDREEEDFEDNGTSSTKKWKRPRKVAPEQSDQVLTTDATYHGNGDRLGGSVTAYDLGSNLGTNPSSTFWRKCGAFM